MTDGPLDKIRALADATERVVAATEFIARGDSTLARARDIRVDALVELRDGGATWPYLRQLTGLSEQYLRRAVSERRNKR